MWIFGVRGAGVGWELTCHVTLATSAALWLTSIAAAKNMAHVVLVAVWP